MDEFIFVVDQNDVQHDVPLEYQTNPDFAGNPDDFIMPEGHDEEELLLLGVPRNSLWRDDRLPNLLQHSRIAESLGGEGSTGFWWALGREIQRVGIPYAGITPRSRNLAQKIFHQFSMDFMTTVSDIEYHNHFFLHSNEWRHQMYRLYPTREDYHQRLVAGTRLDGGNYWGNQIDVAIAAFILEETIYTIRNHNGRHYSSYALDGSFCFHPGPVNPVSWVRASDDPNSIILVDCGGGNWKPTRVVH